MPANANFQNQVMELLAPCGEINSRSMFGGYGIFHEGVMFALISEARLFFKVDDSNRAAYVAAGSTRFKVMPYYEVPAEVFEDGSKMCRWADAAMAVAHAAAGKKRK